MATLAKSALFLLALTLATSYMAHADASRQLSTDLGHVDGHVDVKLLKLVQLDVKVDLLKCKRDAKVKFVIPKLLNILPILLCPKGKVTPLLTGLLELQLGLLGLLKVEITVLNEYGQLVTAEVDVNLLKLGKVVKGVLKLVLELVEDVEKKVLKVVCDKKVLLEFDLKLHLSV